MTDKPNKKLYKNQKEIFNIISKELKRKYLKDFKRVYLMGSLVTKTFGVYEREYEGYLGSDIDLAGIPKSVNKKWTFKGMCHDWHNTYQIGIIELNNIKHPINLMIPLKQDLRLLFKKSKELNMGMIRLK